MARSAVRSDLSSPKLPEKPPEYLGKFGRILWRKLVPYLSENSKVIKADKYLLAQYCSSYDNYRRAYQHVQENGLVQEIYKTSLSPTTGEAIAKDFQGYKKNPAYTIMSDSLAKMNQIGRELGLSPKARSEMLELKTGNDEKQDVSSQISKFFQKG